MHFMCHIGYNGRDDIENDFKILGHKIKSKKKKSGDYNENCTKMKGPNVYFCYFLLVAKSKVVQEFSL